MAAAAAAAAGAVGEGRRRPWRRKARFRLWHMARAGLPRPRGMSTYYANYAYAYYSYYADYAY